MQVLEHDRRALMAGRAHRDDPRVAVGGERIVQPEREREVPEMVRGELHLVALGGELELLDRHDAPRCDEDVERAFPRYRAHGRGVGEVDALGDLGGGRRKPERCPDEL
jgi:hypothetical protein